VRAIAQAAGVDARVIELLNPQLRALRTPKAGPPYENMSFTVRVPVGRGSVVSERLARARVAERMPERSPSMLAADPGRRPEDMARQGNVLLVPPERQSALEGIEDEQATTENATAAPAARTIDRAANAAVTELVSPSTELAKPAELAQRAAAGPSSDERPVAVVPAQSPKLPGRQRVFYRTATGDTLGEIAARFSVSGDELCRWNALDPAARLPDGLMLQVFASRRADLSRVTHLGENDVRCLTVGSDEFFDYFEALRGRKRASIVVGPTDTWERLAKRFNLSVGQLERINQKSRTEKLVPNQTIVVYAPIGRQLTRQEKLTVSEPADVGPIVAPRPDDLPPLPDSSSSGPSAFSP
jgi:membrane-bound lytic murein transglycosylase D